ncbi:MAG: M20/M25/M40 family metallo-hydrolase [Flavobacteriales bacterium]|nr:M20/M25/M40 family metallo-hydrolase [Flavobacteriales bacterium]
MIKNVIDAAATRFLKRYIDTASPTGFEEKGSSLWLDYIRPYVETTYTDTYGTAVAVINPSAPYKVVIEAHGDETSWFVNYISPEGLIYVIRNGGSDHMIAPSKVVNIHTENNGIVKGVFGWPAIHTRLRAGKDKEKAPEVDSIFIDVGADSKKEVEEMGIQVGDVITYPDEFFTLGKDKYVGRALDNRIGCFMIAQVARLLHREKVELPYALYIVNAVQEEVGMNGAKMITRNISPDVAIVTDVTHDTTTPTINKIAEGEISCGAGPVISRAPSVQNALRQTILEAARNEGIPHQLCAHSSSTGTDTEAFAFAGIGTASALISLPLKYMHTTVEMVSRKDVENTIRLIYHSLLLLK